MRSAVVTGATGFVGRALCAALQERGIRVRAIVRAEAHDIAADEIIPAGDFAGDVDWGALVGDADAVFHLAAHVHVLDRRDRLDLARFRGVNRDATARLAAAAADAGVQRFVYLSTIGVNGSCTAAGQQFTEADPARPESPYAISKWEGERALLESSSTRKLHIYILRAPLIYGPGVGAKFLMLLRLVDRGVPLPFRSVRNQRSMVYLGNLVNAMIRVATADAAGSLYLVADAESVATPDLIRRIAARMERRPRLFPLPEAVMRAGAATFGRGDMVAPLFDSLVVSTEKIRRAIGWSARYTLDEGLEETVRWYLAAGAAHA